VQIAEPVRIRAVIGLVHQLGALGVGSEHGVERRCGAAGRFLRDIAEPGAAGHLDLAVVRIDLADDLLRSLDPGALSPARAAGLLCAISYALGEPDE